MDTRQHNWIKMMISYNIGSPIIYTEVVARKPKNIDVEKTLRLLLNSRTSSKIVSGKFCKKPQTKLSDPIHWKTKGGQFMNEHMTHTTNLKPPN